jgi:hypothetical protein
MIEGCSPSRKPVTAKAGQTDGNPPHSRTPSQSRSGSFCETVFDDTDSDKWNGLRLMK